MSANRPDLEPRLVWLFGSPRSGSTWLMALLGAHPLVMRVNEPLIGYHLSPFLSNDLGYRPEDLDLDTFTHRRAMANDPDRFFAEAFSDVWVPGLRRLLNERFEAHLSRFAEGPSDETIVLLKEPNGSQSADVIMRAQPRARLLFLLRDGRDVVDSALASNLVEGWGPRISSHLRGVGEAERLDFVTRFAYQWLWQTEIVETAFADHRGPKRMIRYEDLLRDTPHHLGELFEWLDLPLDPAEIAALADRFAFERIRARGPQQFIRSATPGAWRENLRAEERDAVEGILGAKVRELGYEPEAAPAREATSKRPTGSSSPERLASTPSPKRPKSKPSHRPPARRPQRAKLEAIDYAVERLGVESFASLAIGAPNDQYAFHMMDKPSVERGALVDVRGKRPGNHLLSVIELAAERSELRVLERGYADPRTLAEIGEVDAVLLLDVLFRLVEPDWDRALELYAPATSCLVITNPQWGGGEETIRLIELGRERYLDAVPPSKQHRDLFDRLDEWNPAQQRPNRDSIGVWQWGITDADLAAKLGELGFSLEREWSLNPPRGAEGFVNKTFVFSRRPSSVHRITSG